MENDTSLYFGDSLGIQPFPGRGRLELSSVGADEGPLSRLVLVLGIEELAEVFECPNDGLRRLLYRLGTSGGFSPIASDDVIIWPFSESHAASEMSGRSIVAQSSFVEVNLNDE